MLVETIRDCKGRIACKGDAHTGVIEAVYKGHRTRTQLSIGEAFTVEREGIVTEVTRISSTAFRVESHASAA